MLESKIQAQIIDALRDDGAYVVRVLKASRAGVHDLLCCIPVVVDASMIGQTFGLFCTVEVKRDKGGKISALQEYNKDLVVKAGGRSGFARSIDEARAICKA
jgi:hypothetical protein